MNQGLTESEIEKVVDCLNYSNQTDIMAQKVFLLQTEEIRNKRLNTERIVEALTSIALNSPIQSSRIEANKTLLYLNYQGKGKLLQDDSEATKIGVVIGSIPIIFIFIFGTIVDRLAVGIYLVVISGALLGFIGGVIGAQIGKNKKLTKSASMVGGILGTILGIAAWQFLFLLLFGGVGGIY